MKAGLVSLLTGEATISAIVSSRVYIGKSPQKAPFPHIVITQMDSEENNSLDGSGELRFITYDIDCKAQTSVAAESLASAARTFIKNYSGTAGSFTIGAVLVNGEADDYEPPQDGSDTGVHTVTLDIDVQYNP